jgi:hydrogenase expression/formation protein HypC
MKSKFVNLKSKIKMCLSIPAKVEQIDGEMAVVSVGGTKYNASLQMLDDVKIGDYILMHTGFAIQKMTPEEAIESLNVFKEFEELNKKLDEEERESGKRII